MSNPLERLPASADRLAYAKPDGKPDIRLLQDEYEYAWAQGQDVRTSTWSLIHAEDVRYNRWDGRCWDGLKHAENMPSGREARPYDGAPDCRIPLADETIEAIVDILFVSFYGARVSPRPVHATKLTAQQSAEWKAVVNWMVHGPLAESLINNVEFLAQCGHTFGWCILHPSWSKRHAWQEHELTMDEVVQFCAQAPEGSIMRQIPQMIQSLDKESEDAMVEIFTGLFEGVPAKEARKAIRELRETGQCKFQMPVLVESVPSLEVLVPGIDFMAPPEMTDPQRARVLFRRKMWTTAEIEAAELDEGWDGDFIEAVKRTAGQGSQWTSTTEQLYDENARDIEIVEAFAFQVKDGVPGIWRTVFSPNLRQAGHETKRENGEGEKVSTTTVEGELYARHELVDMAHLKQPFLMYQTEVIGKRPDDARGVPEKLATQQLEMKRQRDALFIRAELETTPPLTKVGGRASKVPPEFGPLAVFNITRQGEWEWFAPPPGNPALAFQLFETIKQERDEQHGLPNAKVHPSRYQARQRRQVMRWLLVWGQALWQLSVLAYQNLSPEELEELLGHPPLLTKDLLLKQRLMMDFDVRTMDPDWVKEMMAELKEIILLDTGGTIDRSKLVSFILNYVDTTLAEEVTTDQRGAARKVFDDVRNEVAQMMLGNEAEYVDNDPTARMKLQFLQQILMQNPDYIMQLHPHSKVFNPRKAELVQKYSQSLQQSVNQQDNRLVGRIGVKPVALDKAG